MGQAGPEAAGVYRSLVGMLMCGSCWEVGIVAGLSGGDASVLGWMSWRDEIMVGMRVAGFICGTSLEAEE